MQKPEHLIVPIVVIRLVGVARDAEFHRDRRVPHRPRHDRFSRHIRVRLPENALESGPIFTPAGDDLADTGKTQIDAMPRIAVEAQMNRALQRAAGRKRQRGELEVGLAKAFPADAGSHGRARQDHASGTEYEHEKGLGIGVAPKLGQGRERDCECNPIHKNRSRPQAEGPVAVLAFGSARRPVLPP